MNHADILADYAAGVSLKRISAFYGVTLSQIYTLARRVGLPKRKDPGQAGRPGRPQGLNAQKVETIRAMRDHATLRTIGNVVGVSQVAVWKVIHGITWSHI